MDPTRRDVLTWGTGAAIVGRSREKTARRSPNVVLILVEDASAKRFGCYGNPICATPSVDGFARTALRFSDAHALPLCNPARTEWFIGRRSSSSRVFDNTHDWRQRLPGQASLVRHLRSHGYRTVRCGKALHHGRGGPFVDDAWTDILDPNEGRGRPPRSRAMEGPGVAQLAEVRASSPEARPMLAAMRWGATGRDVLDEPDGRVAERASRFLRQHVDTKPFFLTVGFHGAHIPWAVPDAYAALYTPEDMPIPRNPHSRPDGMPIGVRFPKGRPTTAAEWRAAIAAHYASITFVDAQVGRVLEAVKTSGREQDTIVVVASDHGFMLGEHFMWGKGPSYDETTRIMLAIRAPGFTRAGTVCDRTVEAIDVMPTVLDLCQVPAPQELEAQSMRTLLRRPAASWKRAAYLRMQRTRTILTPRWRYVDYPRFPQKVALFDRTADPDEHVDRGGDPALASTVRELRALAAGGWSACCA